MPAGPAAATAAAPQPQPLQAAGTSHPATAATASPSSSSSGGGFGAYLAAELQPGPSYPTADVVWGQTERDRVYNAILAVPYQLERFLFFGCAICLDSFLVSKWEEA